MNGEELCPQSFSCFHVALSLTLGACEINVDSPDDPPQPMDLQMEQMMDPRTVRQTDDRW